MYAHIQLGCTDLGRATAFYDAVLAPWGLARANDAHDMGAAGVIWRCGGRRWPQFVLNTPLDGHAPSVANGSQVSFLAPSRAAVDEAWHAALALGAQDEGAPGVRARYAPDFYAAYCRDPQGHKLCFVHTSSGAIRRELTMLPVRAVSCGYILPRRIPRLARACRGTPLVNAPGAARIPRAVGPCRTFNHPDSSAIAAGSQPPVADSHF